MNLNCYFFNSKLIANEFGYVYNDGFGVISRLATKALWRGAGTMPIGAEMLLEFELTLDTVSDIAYMGVIVFDLDEYSSG